LLDQNGQPVPNVTNFNNGEPEWIGVLKYPEYVHSPTNPFIGRYAFMALPIGKTLDLNFIHNYSRALNGSLGSPITSDGFIRDQGVGSWELNLAAFLDALSPAMYQTNANLPNGPYTYIFPGNSGANAGGAFDDASQFLNFRYGYTYNKNYPFSLNYMLGIPPLSPLILGIDEYGNAPNNLTYPFDFTGYPPTTAPWPGTYNSNMFYDVQDLFDQTKTGPYGVTTSRQNFYSRLTNAVAQLDTTNRYTFQRLLDCIGTSSAPEYGVYVYSNLFAVSTLPTSGALPPPSWLRTKVNINYDNTAQIQAGPYSQTAAGPYGPYTPMPTNLTNWTPLGFFTNAADLLLRSQVFVYTNYVTNLVNGTLVYTPSNYLLATFGITNIPVYAPNNPGVVYNEQVHRMLQLAANIYAAANPSNISTANGLVPQPPVFRPQLGWSNANNAAAVGPNSVLYITNFVQVTNNGYAQITQNNKGFYDLSDPRLSNSPPSILGLDPNFWGIPWVIGAVKGLPAFDQYSYTSRVLYYRQLYFNRYLSGGKPDTTKPPQYTNQYYVMQISNIIGMDAWNPYISNFSGVTGNLTVFATNFVTISVTNNTNFVTNIYVTNALYPPYPNFATWQAGQFKNFLQTNVTSLPLSYYSEGSSPPSLVSTANGYLTVDATQTHWPVHNWSLNITNHLCYALFDGSGAVYDFVNLGPFGSSTNISAMASNAYNGAYSDQWVTAPATDDAGSLMSQGVLNQIKDAYSYLPFYVSLNPSISLPGTSPIPGPTFTTQAANQSTINPPYDVGDCLCCWMACDPLVHYTVGDLIYPGYNPQSMTIIPTTMGLSMPSNNMGSETIRYKSGIANGAAGGSMLLGDPGMTSADAWQFPTNLFPGVGWLGRVHRGTPWQTIYLKSDYPSLAASWSTLEGSSTAWVNSFYTYPTNDWSLIDLFTAVPNDNAARGLLSVNQTNDAAWAAVFAGVIVITNSAGGIPLNPTNDVYYLMDSANGINAARTNQPNGIFHKIGDILQASSLTVAPPEATTGPLTDEMVERIPQQTLGLLKVGLPQFVIYSWGQSLKPKNLYSAFNAPVSLNNICTNYEITGEYLTRTVCHIVSDPGAAAPRIVIDNYNIEPGN
jgi:hypothetical protein